MYAFHLKGKGHRYFLVQRKLLNIVREWMMNLFNICGDPYDYIFTFSMATRDVISFSMYDIEVI